MRRALSFSLLFSVLQFSQAVDVYLNPPHSFLRSTLSPEDASSALSRHLGLEAFEPLRDASNPSIMEEPFIGQGSRDALLLTIDEQDAKVVLPSSLQRSFELAYPKDTKITSLSSVISTYLHRARHSYSSIIGQLDGIDSLVSVSDSQDSSTFAAVEIKHLSQLRRTYGPSSQEYRQAADDVRALLERAFDNVDHLRTAVLTFDSSSFEKRQSQPQESQSPLPSHPSPQEPIGSISTCFASVDTCSNSTNSCSGRGQCVKATKSGRTCFVCTCGVTKTGEGAKVKTETWVGQSCERKDVSGPFVLLTGTVLVMILLVFGSISLLYGVGDNELPSTLMGTVVNARKD